MYICAYVFNYIAIYQYIYIPKYVYMYICMCIYTVTTFKYVEGGPDREAQEVV